jgi:alpha-beta hydrolase superfamily lysophospholipase
MHHDLRGVITWLFPAFLAAWLVSTMNEHALCRAADSPQSKMVATGGIHLAVYEAGEGPAVVLCHGFPELAYSWRYQLPALGAAGYHVIAPDQRGYGASDRPADVKEYRIDKLCADLVGLLDAQ